MNTIWTGFLASLIRWLLASLLGGLVMRGIISAELYEKVTTDGATQITAVVLGMVVPLVWSFWSIVKFKVEKIVALRTSPEPNDASALKRVEDKAAAIPVKEKLKLALETSSPLETTKPR